jgi:alpha-tubulin suppressor-like RCC1 family protein
VLSDGGVKCWGTNLLGQLGVPGETQRGGVPGDMGDQLPEVALGGTIDLIAAGGAHTCVKIHETSQIQCWGENRVGELGLGDTNNRGDDPGEMGANLPAVDVDF